MNPHQMCKIFIVILLNRIPLPMDGVEIPVDHEKAEEYKKLGNDKFISNKIYAYLLSFRWGFQRG